MAKEVSVLRHELANDIFVSIVRPVVEITIVEAQSGAEGIAR